MNTSKELTHEYLKSILHYDPDTGIFTRLVYKSSSAKTGCIAGYLTKSGYICITIDYKRYYSHRLAWLYMTGVWPKHQIDHADGVKRNNIFSNLREATNSENGMNKPMQSNNTSGYIGVYFNKINKNWNSRISLNKKQIHLGCFNTPEEAHKAYLEATKKYFCEFANAN